MIKTDAYLPDILHDRFKAYGALEVYSMHHSTFDFTLLSFVVLFADSLFAMQTLACNNWIAKGIRRFQEQFLSKDP